MNRFGYEDYVWKKAIAEGKAILIGLAKRRETLTYTEFVGELYAIQLEPQSECLAELLGEISREEVKEERGMLSALVVRVGDFRPGDGFFELARQLEYKFGDDAKDIFKFWVKERRRVNAVWARPI